MDTIYDLVEEILQQNGFRCQRKDAFILAKKADAEAAICLQKSFDIKGYEQFLQEFNYFRGRKILAVMEKLSEEDAEIIDSEIIIWDIEVLEREMTRYKIDSSIEEETPSIVKEIGTTDFPPIISAEMLEDASLGDYILRLNVSEEQIKKEYPQSSSRNLQLTPYYIFYYSLKSAEEELNRSRKIIAINSSTGNVEEWQELDFIYALETPHMYVESRINKEEAEKLAVEKIIADNSHTKEYIIEDSQTTLTEKRKIAPKKEEIYLDYQHSCHVPIWHIINDNDEIYINAHDRKISDIHKSNTIVH